MYNLIEYGNNYSGATECRWQYKDESKNIKTDFNSFTFKARLLANTSDHGIINTEIAVPLKT